MEKIKIHKNKEFYCSRRKDGEKLYFSLDITSKVIDFTISGKNNRTLYIECEIEYLSLSKSTGRFNIENTLNTSNTWILETKYDNSCSFSHTVMINQDYRSYGVATLVMNKMLLITKQYIPNYSLKGELVNIYPDASEDNYERRDKLYRHLGFTLHDNGFYIDSVSNLKLKENIENIKKIDIKKELNILVMNQKNLESEISNLNTDKKYLYEYNKELIKNVSKLKKYLLVSLGIVVIIVITLKG